MECFFFFDSPFSKRLVIVVHALHWAHSTVHGLGEAIQFLPSMDVNQPPRQAPPTHTPFHQKHQTLGTCHHLILHALISVLVKYVVCE